MGGQVTFDNYRIVAAKSYYRVNYSQNEFERDLGTFMVIRRAFTRYRNRHSLNVRVILNKIITLCNVFEPEATVKLLFLLLPKDYYGYITPFMRFLNILPRVVYGVAGEDIVTDSLECADRLYKELLEI